MKSVPPSTPRSWVAGSSEPVAKVVSGPRRPEILVDRAEDAGAAGSGLALDEEGHRRARHLAQEIELVAVGRRHRPERVGAVGDRSARADVAVGAPEDQEGAAAGDDVAVGERGVRDPLAVHVDAVGRAVVDDRPEVPALGEARVALRHPAIDEIEARRRRLDLDEPPGRAASDRDLGEVGEGEGLRPLGQGLAIERRDQRRIDPRPRPRIRLHRFGAIERHVHLGAPRCPGGTRLGGREMREMRRTSAVGMRMNGPWQSCRPGQGNFHTGGEAARRGRE